MMSGNLPAQELSPYQQAHAVRRLPSLLEWLSFMFSAGNLLAGPYFELADYLAYIERRGPWDPKATRQPSLGNQYLTGVRLQLAILATPCTYKGSEMWLLGLLKSAVKFCRCM